MIDSQGSRHFLDMHGNSHARALASAFALAAVFGCTPATLDDSGDEESDESDDESDESGDESGDEAPRQLCDGSMDLRLGWMISGGGEIRAEIEREIGFAYLYVRGDCRYWVLPFQSPPIVDVFETHTGILDAEAEAALSELVGYGEWDEVADRLWLEPGSFDVTTTYVQDGERMFACDGNCPEAPELAQRVSTACFSEFLALWQAGEPLAPDAPVRAIANATIEPPDPEVFDILPWTPSLELDTVAVEFDLLREAGMTTRIDDATLATELRAFRAEYPAALATFQEIFVDAGDSGFYEFYVRDALPFEDEQGLVTWPTGA